MGDYMRRLVTAVEFVLSGDRQAEADSPIDPAEFGVSATLKPHQVEGVSWLIRRYLVGTNVILGDEMGLGKTLQAISFLNYLKIKSLSPGPFLVLCPLSVTDSWMTEFANFCPTLKVLRYVGDKKYRCGLRRALFEDVKRQTLSSDGQLGLSFDVLLTTYDIAILDKDFLSQIPWHFSVIDEAQRLKNPSSVLYNVLEQQFIIPRRLLMTGTPIQNNLSELWALMHFCLPLVFGTLEQFLSTFKEKRISSTDSTEADDKGRFKILKYILKAFMLRRTKPVLVENGTLVLPSLIEVTVIVPLVSLQKKVYVSILRRELPKLLALSSGASTHQSLQNMVIQLRKACSHPYLFNGIEPEPFEEGEHLVQASGKLIVLDLLLCKLQKSGHRVLLFAQMTHTLDILQDFLELRNYTYERLDGSVRAEERFAAIKSFSVAVNPSDNQDNTFVFMISTRAGGVGLNLVAADTVIFYEQDWNPQVDKQALQRAHRIGQRNNVLSIRLVTEHTIEEVIMRRAESKLHLSDEIVGVDDVHGEAKMGSEMSHDMRSLIFGLQLFDPAAASDSNSYELDRAELDKMAKKVLEMRYRETLKDVEQKFEVNSKGLFSGQNLYNRNPTSIHLDPGIDEATYLAWVEKFKGASEPSDSISLDIGKRITLSDDIRVKHETKMRKAEEKKLAKWEALGYKSLAVKEPICTADADITQDAGCVQFVYGDCTTPSNLFPSEPTIIFSCVDDSGNWGRGGMFDALANLSDTVTNAYNRAHEFGDLHLGDLHLIQINDTQASAPQWVALAVVQSYNPRRKVPRSDISLNALESCLSKASSIAAQNSASIHMPRIGYQVGSQRSEWYTVERLLRKYSVIYGIKIFVYYFRRQS